MENLITFTEFFKANCNDFDAILFDIDGTLSLGKDPIPGAREFIEFLDEIDFPYLYVTNDSGNAPVQKAGYMNKGGIPARPERILSAGHALKLWAAEHYRGGKFFLMGEMGNPSYIDAAGIPYTSDPDLARECCGIFCGEGPYNWRESIEAAFNLMLKHPEYPLIVGNPDSYWASLRFRGWGIGSGSIARFICQVLQDAGKTVTPFYLGKPYPTMYKCVFPFLHDTFPELKFNDPKRIIMVGDSLVSDIAGANANGLTSALLMSGITNDELLKNAPEHQKPDMVFKSI